MFKVIATLLFATMPVLGQTRLKPSQIQGTAPDPPIGAGEVWLHQNGSPVCRITNASNSTPVVVTFSTSGPCPVSNGSMIRPLGVRGNTAVNIHLDNPLDVKNLVRRVGCVNNGLGLCASNQFQLLDGAGGVVAGNGDYIANSGSFDLVQSYRVKPGPILFLDGTGGAKTLALSDPAKKKNTSNPAYVALVNGSNAFNVNYKQGWGYEWFSQGQGIGAAMSAIRCQSDNDAAACEAALWSLRNPQQLLGMISCDPGVNGGGCGTPNSSMTDYTGQWNIRAYAQAFSIMAAMNKMTLGEIQNFVDFTLTDLPWDQGGIGYKGTMRAKPTAKATVGTVNLTQSGSLTLTGTGTKFTSYKPGDILTLPCASANVYAQPYKIASVESDTSLTLSTPYRPMGAGTTSCYQVSPQWDGTMFGAEWHWNNWIYAPDCGQGLYQEAVCTFYNVQAGLYGKYEDSNHVGNRTHGRLALGLATCPYDPRGCLLASKAESFIYTRQLPSLMQIWTGVGTQMGPVYVSSRALEPMLENHEWIKNSVVDGPTLVTQPMLDKMAAYLPWGTLYYGGGLIMLPITNGGLVYLAADRQIAGLHSMALNPGSAAAKNLQWWLKNIAGLTASTPRYGGDGWNWLYFTDYDPTIPEAPIVETTRHFVDNDAAGCTATYGTVLCSDAPDVRRVSISKTGWTQNSTYLMASSEGYACRDHCEEVAGGYYYVFHNNKELLGPDSPNILGERAHRNFLLPGLADTIKGYPNQWGLPVPWAGGTNDWMLVRTVLTPMFTTAANVANAEQLVTHIKKGARNYVIVHRLMALNSAGTIKGIEEYPLNGSGTPLNNPNIQLNRAAKTISSSQSTAKVITNWIGFGAGQIAATTANNSNTDLRYPEGTGAAGRVTMCPSDDGTTCAALATSIEYASLHKISTALTEVMPPHTEGTAGAFHFIEVQDGTFYATTTLGLVKAASFKTSFTVPGFYVVAGFEPGNYAVACGTAIPFTVVATAKSPVLAFDCPGGAVEIAQQ